MGQAPVSVDLSGRSAVVTGANAGIGLVTARELARAGAHVTLACRSEEKATAAMAQIRDAVPGAEVAFLALDLNSLAAVREAAATLLLRDHPIHILVNNAGLAGARGLTADGFELAFGVNHLGPFLFTNLLLDRIIASGPARIVCVASRAHYRCDRLDFDVMRRPTRNPTGYPEYGVSKLANVLFARELARQLADRNADVSTYSLHPGVVASEIWRKVPWPIRPLMTRFMITNDQGALTSLHCATSPECADETGRFYDKCRVTPPSVLAQDDALAAELWRRSAEWVGLHPGRSP